MNFKREFSAGCVVFRALSIKYRVSNIQFLLGKHSGYHKWVLPKGLIEKGERGFETALRETEEEMGIKARLLHKKPIHTEKYIYWADPKEEDVNSKSEARNSKQIPNSNDQNPKQFLSMRQSRSAGNNPTINTSTDTRRVIKYQEAGGGKVKVFKTVSFYLAEYVEGNPRNHGWEMEEADWYSYDEALEIMSFKGEKQALGKANNLLLKFLNRSL